MLEALKKVQLVQAGFPNSMIVQLFAVAKGNEVVEIMSKAPRDMQRQVYGIMAIVDPANVSKYEKFK